MTGTAMKRHAPMLVAMAMFLAMNLAGLDWGRMNERKLALIGYDAAISDSVARASVSTFDEQRHSSTITTTLFGHARHEDALRIYRRYLLYTEQSDEYYTFLAFGRMNPAKLDFNPRNVQYGNGYLLPLGAWLKFLSLCGLVEMRGGLAYYLAQPLAMARLYLAGRYFILFSGLLAIPVLFATMRRHAPGTAGRVHFLIFATAILGPAGCAYYHSMKPHAFTVLPVAVSLFFAWRHSSAPRARDLLLSALFAGATAAAVIFWIIFPLFYLPLLWRRPRREWLAMLTGFGAGFLMFNFFYLVDWRETVSGLIYAFNWYGVSAGGAAAPAAGANRFMLFFANGLPAVYHSFGPAFCLLLAAMAVNLAAAWRGWPAWRRAVYGFTLMYSVFILLLVCQSPPDDVSGARYLFPVLPLFMLAALDLLRPAAPWRRTLLALVVIGTLWQMLLAAGYSVIFLQNAAGNDPRYAAGEWITRNVPPGASLQTAGSFTPFRSPYFPIRNYAFIMPDEAGNRLMADYYIFIEYDGIPPANPDLANYLPVAAWAGARALGINRPFFAGLPITIYQRRPGG